MNALVDRCFSFGKNFSASVLQNLLISASALIGASTIIAAPALAALSGPASAQSEFTPTAYIYSGTGACAEGCVDAVIALALRNRLPVVLVDEFTLNDGRIQPRVGDLWIQPGGEALQTAQAMGPRGLERIRNWVSKGVNYLGFCAGAFLADQTIDDPEVAGLGLIPFSTADFSPEDSSPKVLRQIWRGSPRWIYFEEGATFLVHPSATVRVIATYADHQPSVIETRFQAGKVVLSGAHPEAPIEWAESSNLLDPDGSDHEFADELLRIVADL